MSKAVLENQIKTAVKCSDVILSMHCRQQMIERNITTQDIMNVLSWGSIANIENGGLQGDIKVKVHGRDIDGDDLTVIVIARKDDVIIKCITAF